jgi:hypothetical protein
MRFISILCFAFIVVLSAGSLHAQPGNERQIDVDGEFNVDFSWFDAKVCKNADAGMIRLRVGKQHFSVKPSEVTRGKLKRLKRFELAQQAGPAGGATTVPFNAGCPEQPLELVQFEIKANSKELPKHVVIVETPDRGERMSPAAKYIQFLSGQGQCKTTKKARIISCAGSRKENGKSIGVLFAVLTQPDGKVELLDTGSPIHASCELVASQLACLVSAETNEKTTIKGSVDLASLTAESLAKRHGALLRFAASIAAKR